MANKHVALQHISLPANMCTSFHREHTMETAFMHIFQRDSACATLVKDEALQQIVAAPDKVFGYIGFVHRPPFNRRGKSREVHLLSGTHHCSDRSGVGRSA